MGGLANGSTSFWHAAVLDRPSMEKSRPRLYPLLLFGSKAALSFHL